MFNYNTSKKNKLLYPSLWDGCFSAICPSITGPTGIKLPDLSGNGNFAVLSDLTPDGAWETGEGKYGIYCPGIGPAMTLSVARQEDTNKFSFTCWAKFGSNEEGSSLCWLDGNPKGLQFYSIGNDVLTGIWDGTEEHNASNGSPDYYGKWVFAGMVVNGTSLTTYVGDGSFIPVESTLDGYIESINGSWYLGFGASANVMDCSMDDMRFYNRALSRHEINILQQGRGIAYKQKRSSKVGQISTINRRLSSRPLCFPV